MVTLYTFGDSILDCGRYNEFGVHPGQLSSTTMIACFEFRSRLASRGSARLEHRALNGATVDSLPFPDRLKKGNCALITIGGNDLLRGLIRDTGAGIATFANTSIHLCNSCPSVLFCWAMCTIPRWAMTATLELRARSSQNLQRMNTMIQEIANRYGQLVDLHAHFLTGDLSWFTATIEPSLKGASEVMAAFLPCSQQNLIFAKRLRA